MRRTGSANSERGAALIEFAISSLVFFMMLFGIMQFGLAVWNYNMLSSLAQDGARYAAVRGSNCLCGSEEQSPSNYDETVNYVLGRVVGMNPAAVTVTPTWPTTDNEPGDPVRVEVSYTFSLFTKIVRTGSITMRGVARMQIMR